MATSVNDNNFYRNGDSSNNTEGQYISPIDGSTPLSNATNKWGYLLPASTSTVPDSTYNFLPVSSGLLYPTVLKTTATTSSEQDINDRFSIYYGANAGPSLPAGTYKLSPTNPGSAPVNYGGLVYYLTMDSTCSSATLISGQSLNTKMKRVAGDSNANYNTASGRIKSIKMSNSLPADFVPDATNTVSTAGSDYPIYIYYDNTDNAGIMYFYSQAHDIYMNNNSSYAFYANTALSDLSALASWDTSSVTYMSDMFYNAYSLTDLSALSSWDTSSVTNMGNMFYNAYSLTDLSGLSSWDTSSVTSMYQMFFGAYSLTDLSALSSWDTSSVTSMSHRPLCPLFLGY